MPLFAVERDLSQVPPERLRADLRSLVSACARLQGLGKKVRYISSAVFPAEARGLCLFGAEEPQWIREVNEAARLPYSRIFAVLDLTPNGVSRDLSRGRPPQGARIDNLAALEAVGATGGRASEAMERWSEEGRQLLHLLGGWLDDAGRLRAETVALEKERSTLAEQVRRLEEEALALRAQRDDLLDAVQTLTGQVTRTADAILYRVGGRREAPGDLAQR
jgi:Protein of unknown function (DUF4242)